VLEEIFSHYEPVPRTGKRGRPANPIRVLNKDLMYATVKKSRKKGRVVKLERTIVFGDEADIAAHLAASPGTLINTAYVERSNLNWRLWDAHLARKSVTFAKAIRWLEAKLAICVIWYNFVRPHSSLSKESASGQRITPAMFAGIADRQWSVNDVVDPTLFVN
jgi:hypothetical protein